jgi:hypothetical protein
MTGPAQTPVLFLKSGGSAFFSAACQAALVSAALNPDWFGDYEHVSKKIRDAKIKRAQWAAMTTAQQDARPGRRPTREEVFLSNCTASHLSQNGVNTNARVPNADGTPATPPFPPNGSPLNVPGARGRPRGGNPCASLVAGYTEGTAPCFPGEGSNDIPGSMEQRLGDREKEQIAAQRALTGDRYPAAAMRRDENDRSSIVVGGQQQRWNEVRFDPARGGDGGGALVGSGVAGRARTPGEQAGFASAVGASKNGQPTASGDMVISGDTAEACINAWRERAKREMKTKGLDAEVARTTREATPAAQAAAQARHTRAQRKLDRTRADTAAAQAAAAGGAPGTAEALARARAAESAAGLRAANATDALRRTQNAAQRLPCLRAMQPGGSNSTNQDGRTFPP